MPLELINLKYTWGIILLWATAHVVQQKVKARDALKKYDLLNALADFLWALLGWILCAIGASNLFKLDVWTLPIAGAGAWSGIRGLNKLTKGLMNLFINKAGWQE